MSTVRLGYRILELPAESNDLANDGIEKGRFYDVRGAMEAMKREFKRRATKAPNWFLIAPNQQVLLSPDDFLEEGSRV